MFWPGGAVPRMMTVPPTDVGPAGSIRLSSTLTTQSAPSGSGAPVMILVAAPAVTATEGSMPAMMCSTIRSRVSALAEIG